MLSVEGLTVGFAEGVLAIRDVAFELADGEALLVCGAASAGKSTLVAALAGVVPRLVRARHFSGAIRLDGTDTASLADEALFTRLGVVLQSLDDQLWDLGVEDLIAFALENRGYPRADIRATVGAMLGALRIEGLRGRRVLTLSGGERRLVAIAAALAGRPRLLLLDEPTTGLDPGARLRLQAALRAGPAAGGRPMLLVTEQDGAALGPLPHRRALLHEGRLALLDGAAAAGAKSWRAAGLLPPGRQGSWRPARPVGATLLEVAGLRTALARADGSPVLAGVSFAVRGGEVVGLVGRNGAGKTTLLQAILGLVRITGGSVAIGGAMAAGWTPARRARQIGYLPQSMRRVLFNLTVQDEMVFALTGQPRRGSEPALLERARAALAAYGLEALAEASPFGLSSRQQARLGLACIDAAGCDLAVLDEPLLARDLEGRRLFDGFLERLTGNGRAAIVISHDLELVDDVADRLLLLDEGRIAYDGPVEQGWRSPAFRALGWPPPTVASAA
jgi:energy-coupling factor transporter ATP-binding protein EcfA2